MENYIVSARKYRPETFQTVIGQPAITTTLKNAIRTKQLAHAYLFCGPRGIGKTTCARIFAKTINCFQLTTAIEACNECESCLSFNTSRSYNIHELDGASNNSVDDIRSLIEQVRIPPQVGKYSIYIIDEVHMLSANAFNAFLKTLEEPPAHAIFILATTEKHKILPTILSRCQIFDFNRIKTEDIANHLEEIARSEGMDAEKEALEVIAQKADGAMRDALSIFDQIASFSGGIITYQNVIDNLNILDYDYYFKMTGAILAGNISGTLLIFNEILSRGFDAHNLINGLSRHLRDLLVCRDEVTIQLLDSGAGIREKYKSQSKECTQEFILKSLGITNQCDLSYRSSKNQRLHVELCLLQLCALQAGEKKKSEPLLNRDEPPPGVAAAKAINNRPDPAETIEQNPENPENLEKQSLETPSMPEKQASPQIQGAQGTPKVAETPAVPPVTTKSPADPKDPETTQYQSSRNEQKGITSEPGTLPSFNTLSIKDAMNGTAKSGQCETVQAPEPDDDDVIPGEPDGDDDFTEKELTEQWKKFANQIRNKHPRLYNTLLANKPSIISRTGIEFELSNPLQQEALDRIKPELLNHLRRELNRNIDLLFSINEKVTEKRLYTPEDKFEHMLKKNPALAVLRQKFNLDFD
jgi:DNA polymerase III subunit gamma/tau